MQGYDGNTPVTDPAIQAPPGSDLRHSYRAGPWRGDKAAGPALWQWLLRFASRCNSRDWRAAMVARALFEFGDDDLRQFFGINENIFNICFCFFP